MDHLCSIVFEYADKAAKISDAKYGSCILDKLESSIKQNKQKTLLNK